MRRIFGFIIILSTVNSIHSYECSNYYILVNETNTEVEVVPDPSIVDTTVFKSINSSIPKECYIGLNCVGVSTECSLIHRRKSLYGADEKVNLTTKSLYGADEKVNLTTTSLYGADEKVNLTTKSLYGADEKVNLTTKSLYGADEKVNLTTKSLYGADEKVNLTTKCRKDIKHYLTSDKCNEENDTATNSSTAFYRCNALPYEDCGRTILDEYSPSNLTREHRENCESYITHIEKLNPNSSDFLPYSLRPYAVFTNASYAILQYPRRNVSGDPANFQRFSCIDYSTTCILNFDCTDEGKNCINIYRYKPTKNENYTECLSTEATTSTALTLEAKTPTDSTNATTTKPPTSTSSTLEAETPTDSTNATTTKPPTSTVSTLEAKTPTNSTNATTTKPPTSTASTLEAKTPTDSTNATTTKPPTTRSPISNATTPETKSSTDSANATTTKPLTTTAPTTVLVTEAPTDKLNRTYNTNTKNFDLTKSGLDVNDGFRGFILELLGNTSETNFIVYVVLICVALFVGGMLLCLAVMTCARRNKRRKYEAVEETAHDSPGGEETLPMDIINQIGTADPTEEYFLLTSKVVRESMRSCSERRSYLKSEDFT